MHDYGDRAVLYSTNRGGNQMAHLLSWPARTGQARIGWIVTGMVLANTLGAAFAIAALGDVQYSRAVAVSVMPPSSSMVASVPSSAPSRLTFRSQKPGTKAQLMQAQRRRQELALQQDALQMRGTAIARQTHAAAIAQIDRIIADFYEPATLDATDIAHAWIDPNLPTAIAIQFTATGGQKFAQLTQRLAGTEQTLGMFLEGHLLMAPSVDAAYASTGITGGKVQIIGNFTPQQAAALVKQLNNR